MKKCYSFSFRMYYRCVYERLYSKQIKRMLRKPSPIISSFLELGEAVDAAKICGGAENVVKTEATETFVKWIARFYYFRHLYSAGSACVLLTIIVSCPSIWATLSALLINILLGSFQLFLHSDQPLSEGEIIPFDSVCQSKGGRIIPRRKLCSH